MSLLNDLSLLLQKYPNQDLALEASKDDEKAAKHCINLLNRLIGRAKEKKPKKNKELSKIQKKKLAEKAFITQIPSPEDNSTSTSKKCYVCKQSIQDDNHLFYGSMCSSCGDYNQEMRNKTKDLTGQTAIITGGRIKIGYQAALWLLRNNCHVIVTTRFPADALLRYKTEPDYDSFKDRLTLYGLDFRDLKKVYQFIDYVTSTFKEINILINNAAQTLYQTDEYNMQLMQDEEMALKAIQQDPDSKNNSGLPLVKPNTSTSTMSNQLCLLQNEFPVYDINHIPVDFSSKNSWTKQIDEIDFREFAEAQVINSWVPFILCSNLKKIMTVPNKKSFIINVSAMEGKFDYTGKSSAHPHTNMAKASMNMLTRTCGSNFAKSGIYMTSADTGWCSEMNPNLKLSSLRTVPLDEIDGAMRILHPVIEDLTLHSVLLKDYKITTW